VKYLAKAALDLPKLSEFMLREGLEYEVTTVTRVWLQKTLEDQVGKEMPGRAEGCHLGPDALVVQAAKQELSEAVQWSVEDLRESEESSKYSFLVS
jgi:hypothetical protein